MRLLFATAAAVFVAAMAFLPVLATGDASDYLGMQQALVHHGTPDLRPEDLASTGELLLAAGFEAQWRATVATGPAGLHGFTAHHGAVYSSHFWLFPLLTLPARRLLLGLGGNELASFQMTNAAILCAALYAVLFLWRVPGVRRLGFAGLAAGGPVLLYVRWMSPEVYTWALVTVALVLLGNERFAAGAAAAALASMQNPAAGALAAAAVAIPALRRQGRAAAWAGMACAVGAIPPAFYAWHFGKPNMVAGTGNADPRLMSLGRTASLLLDLNQGMLPYLPVTLLLGGTAVARALWRRDVPALCVTAGLGGMAAVAESTINWNSACAGLMRYAVWMTPVLAWLAVSVPPARPLGHLALAGTVLQLGLSLARGDADGSVSQTRLASLVLSRAPRLYPAEPEIFCERQPLMLASAPPFPLPVPFVVEDGGVTKLLADAAVVRALPQLFEVEPAYAAEALHRHETTSGMFYLHPPRGAVRMLALPTARELARSLALTLAEAPSTRDAPEALVSVRVRNEGERPFWGFIQSPLLLGSRTMDASGTMREGKRVRVTPCLRPGQDVTVTVALALPEAPGSYLCEILPMIEGVGWGQYPAALSVDVTMEDPSRYLAVLKPVAVGRSLTAKPRRKVPPGSDP